MLVKPRWAFAGAALLATAGVAGALIVASPGGEEEVVQQVETATQTATAPASETTATATRSPDPLPPDWQTYNDPAAGFTLRYPPDWYLAPEGHRIASWDLATWTTPRYPPGGILIDFDRIPLAQAGPRPSDASDTTLGGAAAWERTLIGAEEADWEKAHRIVADRGMYQYLVFGAFAEANADEFQQIVSSFQFTDK